MSLDQRVHLERELSRAQREEDYHRRRFMDLGQWVDSQKANEAANRAWDLKERMRRIDSEGL